MPRKRNDPRGEVTRLALIEAAEELFWEKGVENVSLRQVGEAIGSENNGVVTYYFGSKDGLLRSIYEYRIMGLEFMRLKLLQKADETGRGHDAFTLFYALFAPIFKQRNAKGKPSYAGFLLSVTHFGPLWLVGPYPSPREIIDRLQKLQDIPEKLFRERMRLVSTMLMDAVHDAVKLQQQGATRIRGDAMFADALQMAAAAFTAPVVTLDALRRLQTALADKATKSATKRGSDTAN